MSTPTPLATQQQFQALFSSLETIYNFNCLLLKNLEQRLSEWPGNPKIGTTHSSERSTDPIAADIFIELAPMLKLYVDYVNNFNSSISAHQELLKDKKKGKAFLEWSQLAQKNAGSNVDLGALLIMPVQRCPGLLQLSYAPLLT